MARNNIELGALPTGQGGDTFRSAMIKVNDMTREIYGDLSAGAEQIAKREHVLVAGKNITIDRTNPDAPVVSAKGGEVGVGSTEAPVAQDCNTITVGGVYTLTAETLNSPIPGTYSLFHEPHGSAGAYTQIAIGTGPGAALWCRSNSGPWGRLIKTGDHGLGVDSPTYIADANAMPQTGRFRVNEATANIPIKAPGSLVCYSVLPGNLTQVFIPTRGYPSGESMWFRAWGGGTPSPWRQLVKLGDFGLGSTSAPVLTDLNAFDGSGKYRFGSTAANAPAAVFGTVEVTMYDATNWTQLALSTSSHDKATCALASTGQSNHGFAGMLKKGESAAGSWLKFPHGVMMAWTPATARAIPALYSGTTSITLPVAFVGAYQAFGTVQPITSWDQYGCTACFSADASTVNIGVRNGPTAQDMRVSVFCIGRWK